MIQQELKQALLSAIYTAARVARDMVWGIQRPTLLGVRGLVVRNHEVLLIRHRSGERPWALPGGGVDRHERFEEAVRREVYEEAGVPADVECVLGVYEAFHSDLSNYIVTFVLRSTADPRPPQSIEIAEARYFAFDDLPTDLDRGSHRRIAEYRAGRSGVSALW
ncbi:MAG TPA: NUDIX domain-containing protein [Roseiflexaceae bacterium]|nr:NUDIX domain-containing protein [Roseiflexaceae bacterium]HMP41402.1 NUDIX domain-containing protein [Roseiflexaceae bacterium]